MRNSRLWRMLPGVDKTVVVDIAFDEVSGVLLSSVGPTRSMRQGCSVCHRHSPRYDAGSGRRRWRALDVGTIEVHLEAQAPRVSCRTH